MIVPLVRIGFMLSWLTIYFIPRKTMKRYIPASTMSALLVMTTVFIGTHFFQHLFCHSRSFLSRHNMDFTSHIRKVLVICANQFRSKSNLCFSNP